MSDTVWVYRWPTCKREQTYEERDSLVASFLFGLILYVSLQQHKSLLSKIIKTKFRLLKIVPTAHPPNKNKSFNDFYFCKNLFESFLERMYIPFFNPSKQTNEISFFLLNKWNILLYFCVKSCGVYIKKTSDERSSIWCKISRYKQTIYYRRMKIWR